MTRKNPLRTDLNAKQKNRFTLRNILLASGLGSALILAGILAIQSTDETTSTQAFTNVAIAGAGNAGTAAAISGAKDGGFAWGDINQDGFLDLVVNTNSGSQGTRILISNPADPANPYFEDKTATLCKHCSSSVKERSAILADLNHDGYPDLIRNTSMGSGGGLDIYLNRGPAEGYQFGTGVNHTPHKTIYVSNFSDNKMNTEGVFVADYDNDGWLDIIIENHDFGIDIFANPRDGTANFTHVDAASIGLPLTATDGDYGSCVDYDNDGDIDILARKRGQSDFYRNNGDGTFTAMQDIAEANNNNKGGVVFADFDNDGDYDLFWTDNGTNQIFLNDGSGLFAPTATGSRDGEPWYSAGVTAPGSGIDGCAAGDVNNDGKIDLFLTADNGPSYLFLNNTPDGGALSFTRNNLGINVNGNGEGCAFADYDNDGDLDLYINVHNGNNQLWRNDLNDNNYLFVEARIDLGGGVYRAAIGANITLKDCFGNVRSGIREVPTVAGHGTDSPDKVHFGLPGGPDDTYQVLIEFVSENGQRITLERSIIPSILSGQTLVVSNSDPDDVIDCTTMPVAWLDFAASRQENDVLLTWATAHEQNSDFFLVDRSYDGRAFEGRERVTAAGFSAQRSDYHYLDTDLEMPTSKAVFYRLKQVDLDGSFHYSSILELQPQADATPLEMAIFPNPATDYFKVKPHFSGSARLRVFNMAGNIVYVGTLAQGDSGREIEFDEPGWPPGVYIMELSDGRSRRQEKLVLK